MTRPPLRVLLFSALMALSLGLCLVAVSSGWITPQTLRGWVQRAGAMGLVAYVAGVVLMELLWMPRAWGLLAGGVLFGPWLGACLSVVGDMLGAALCYLLARGMARGWAEDLIRRRPRAARVVDLLARRRGAATVALLRVCPVAHYTLVSYAAGITGVRPRPFLLGTALGLIPAAAIYPTLGHAALQPGTPLFWGALALIAVFLVVTLYAGRRMLR